MTCSDSIASILPGVSIGRRGVPMGDTNTSCEMSGVCMQSISKVLSPAGTVDDLREAVDARRDGSGDRTAVKLLFPPGERATVDLSALVADRAADTRDFLVDAVRLGAALPCST